jgi:type II secretory pathway component PulF
MMTAVPVTGIVLFLVYAVPPFRDIFKDFKTTLPSSTLQLFVISDRCAGGMWVLALPIVLLLPAIPSWLTQRSTTVHKGIAVGLNYLCIILVASSLTMGAGTFALFEPLKKLISSVNEGGTASTAVEPAGASTAP